MSIRDSIAAPKKVAIACQGGGSHAAFAAGVLSQLLTRRDYADRFVVCALTGTSGGALCAALAWSRLLRPAGAKLPIMRRKDRLREKARGQVAAEALQDFWMDLACDDWGAPFAKGSDFRRRGPFDYFDAAGNAGLVSLMRAMPAMEASCRMASGITRTRMLELFNRHLPAKPLAGKPLDNPILRLGATDILQGNSQPLEIETLKPGEIHTALLASASIPPLFQPTQLRGRFYWDGLFSHNPPIDCLTNLPAANLPDEIWVIQINPETCPKPPATPAEIVDRRNELSGNLTLAAELYHIDALNWMLTSKSVPRRVREGLYDLGYRPIALRVVSLPIPLDYASKYDRSRSHIQKLLALGQQAAGGFFSNQSRWTCKASGVHAAAVRPELMQSRSGPARASKMANRPCPNLACPSYAMCNTWPGFQRLAEQSFDLAQKTMEGSYR